MAEPVSLDAPGLEPPDRKVAYDDIPDPITGAKRRWIRATTWADTIEDGYGLGKWKQRKVAIGIAAQDDLRLGVAAVTDPDSAAGKKQLDELTERAKVAAGANTRATIGTALHSFLEADVMGRAIQVPPPYDRDVAAYREATAGIRTSRNYLERICVLPELGVAGTMDRVVQLPQAPLPMIGDIKTGADLRYSWNKIAIQLALYAHADFIWDKAALAHRRMIKVNQEFALVVHLPAGEGRCQLYIVDIAAGWEAARLCGDVRAWRKRKGLAQLLLGERRDD